MTQCAHLTCPKPSFCILQAGCFSDHGVLTKYLQNLQLNSCKGCPTSALSILRKAHKRQRLSKLPQQILYSICGQESPSHCPARLYGHRANDSIRHQAKCWRLHRSRAQALGLRIWPYSRGSQAWRVSQTRRGDSGYQEYWDLRVCRYLNYPPPHSMASPT